MKLKLSALFATWLLSPTLFAAPSLSSISTSSDVSKITYKFITTGTKKVQIFINTNPANTSTGYDRNLHANYLIENQTLHSFAGASPGEWKWTNITPSPVVLTITGTNVTIDIPRAALGENKIGDSQKYQIVVTDSTNAVTKSPLIDFISDQNAANPQPTYPRLGAIQIGSPQDYWTSTYQNNLAKVGLSILSYWPGWGSGVGTNLNTVVQQVKVKNPNTKIFLYVSSSEIEPACAAGGSVCYDVWNQISKTNSFVYLNGTSGTYVKSRDDGGRSYMVNNTLNGPKDSTGKLFIDWFTERSNREYIIKNPSVDGLYMDRVLVNPDVDGDWNRDGITDPAESDAAGSMYRASYKRFFNYIRTLAPQKLYIGNAGAIGTQSKVSTVTDYMGLMNGGVMESFMGKTWSIEVWAGWKTMIAAYKKTMDHMASPRLGIFNTKGAATDYQTFRYSFGSCLMGEAYCHHADPDKGYSGFLWYDEYDVKLGVPLTSTPAYPTTAYYSSSSTTLPNNNNGPIGVFRRDFSNGIVIVNPRGNGTRTIRLEKNYRKILGKQAPAVNNGQVVNTITLPERDAIVLLNN